MQYHGSNRPASLPFRTIGEPTPLPGRWGQAPSVPYSGAPGDGRPSSDGSDGASRWRPEGLALDAKPLLAAAVGHGAVRQAVVVVPPSRDDGPAEDVQSALEDDEEAPKSSNCDVEEEAGDDEALEKAPAPVAELDVERFDHIWRARAADGAITADRLPALLVAAEAPGTDADMLAVIQRVLGSSHAPSDQVNYEQALGIYRRLAVPHEDSMDAIAGDSKQMGHVERWVASMSDSRATNVLLCLVVGVSFTAAFLVAGLAVLFMWMDSFTTLGLQMLEDLGLMKDVMDVFDQEIYVGEVQARAQDISTLVAMVTDYVAYNAVLATDQKNLMYVAAFMAQAVAAWWEYQPEKSYLNVATVMGIWADQVMTAEGDQEAFDIASDIVDTLPAGYEILLGEWTNASNTSFKYVTRLRFQDQCVNQTCDLAESGVTFSPMKAALQGMEGAMETLDYRPYPVFVGFTSVAGIGVEFKADVDVIDAAKYTSLESYFNLQNANALDSKEIMIGRIGEDGSSEMLTKLRFCDDSCLPSALRSDGPMGLALGNQVGVMETLGYTGETVIAAYCPIPSTNLGLVVQMTKNARIAEILQSVAAMLDNINANLLTGSEELELVVASTVNGTQHLDHLTAYKFPQDCPSTGCANVTQYWSIPMNNCSSGSVKTTDYRGASVYAGYYCMSDFNAYLAMKVDDTQVNSDMMTLILRFINERNTLDMGTSYEFLVAQAKNLLDTANVKSFSDFKLLSAIKNPDTCTRNDCSWDSKSILRALQNKPGDLPGLMDDINYANQRVMAAMEYDLTIGGGVGLVLEMDYNDFVAPVLSTVLIIMCFTLGVSIFSTGVLVIVTKKMMHTMITASLEGKRAVEVEKEQFSALVAAMYPKYVVPRLLAGERHIVGHLKHTAVFFSDVYEFTAASNTITSEELIQFMGYTYGVMDDIADRYGIYKVKTVGDAYLAVAGLPGVEPGSGSKDCCLDMMKFASCVAQVFSQRFFHPEKGRIMTVVASTMPWNKRKRGPTSTNSKMTGSEHRTKASVAPASVHLDGSSAWTGKDTGEVESVRQSVISGESRVKAESIALRGKHSNVQCVMSYGVAAGPVTAGVLHGKSPMFDIWGKTVNLASRMETTGQPGRIQVSEHVFRKVAAVPGQPFVFEAGHKAFCKGFGAVNSFFVRSTSEPPPKDLMIQLGLEPRYGLFFFDNVLTAAQRAGAGPKAASGAGVSLAGASDMDAQSITSSHSGMGPNPLADHPVARATPIVQASVPDPN